MEKGLKIVLGVVIVVVIVLGVVLISKKSNSDNTKGTTGNSITTKESAPSVTESSNQKKVNVTDNQLKNTIEKTENGIKISNTKIVSNGDNIVTISLNAKNENKEERIVTLAVTYYNAAGEKIGENGFAVGNLKANESKDMESTCYIDGTDVKDVKIDIKADKIEVNKDKNGDEASPTKTEGTDIR